jgi:SNF2 family DNA or RNA helicase
MGNVSILQTNNTLLQVTFPWNPTTLAIVKGLTGRQFVKKGRYWTIPAGGSQDNISILQRAGFRIDDEVYVHLAKLGEEKAKLSELAGSADADFDSKLPLLPYQKAGAKFLYLAGNAILGDDVGLGKTIQSLAVSEASASNKVLIFCPSVLKYQWQNEIIKFLGSELTTNGSDMPKRMYEYVQVIDGSPKDRAKQWGDPFPFRYYITNYELLLRDLEYMKLTQWDMVIADEATRMSNARSQTAKLIKQIPSRRRLALTGTPVSNKPDDIWSIADFIQPGAFGNYYNFMERYSVMVSNGQYNETWGYKNLEELAERLKPIMIRRTKEQVLPELPEKITTDVPFKLTKKEKELYDKIRKELLFDITNGELDKIENPTTIQLAIVKMLRLRQLCDSMELLGEGKDSSKLEVLRELVKEWEGRKIIVFTEFSQMADVLEREFQPLQPLKITGGVSDNQKRQEIVDTFNSDPNHRLLVMTSAGQFGLNIQAASVVVHYDQPWSLAKVKQRVGRAHRMGQKQSVLEYNLLAKGSVDMYIRRVLFNKQVMSHQILNDVKISLDDIKGMLLYDGD